MPHYVKKRATGAKRLRIRLKHVSSAAAARLHGKRNTVHKPFNIEFLVLIRVSCGWYILPSATFQVPRQPDVTDGGLAANENTLIAEAHVLRGFLAAHFREHPETMAPADLRGGSSRP